MTNCNLCPRKCGANRQTGHHGVCGAPAEIKVALSQLHMWEEPPISGENGSGTIFFSHCPLKCVYCQNRTISAEGKGQVASIEQLQEIMLDLQQKGAENINFVTGTQWAPQIVEAVNGVRRALKTPIVWNTSSYETPETIEMLNEIIDIYLADFKYYSNDLAKKFSGVSDYFEVATSAISAMLSNEGSHPCCRESSEILSKNLERGQLSRRFGQLNSEAIPQENSGFEKQVIVRHLVLPGHIDDSKKVIKHVEETFGNKVKLSIMSQYTPVIKDKQVLEKYPELGRTLSKEEYEEVLDYADSLGIEDYFWQEGETCKESFIPNF